MFASKMLEQSSPVLFLLRSHCNTFSEGCAAYAEGCAAYAEGCSAYAEGCAAYVRQCENITISSFN